MKLDIDKQLFLLEQAGKICFWDIEASGLDSDYNSIFVVSIKPYKQKIKTFAITNPGDDKKLCQDVSKELSNYFTWVTFYGKGYDFPMIQGRLLDWKLPKLDKQPHLDLYFTLKSKVLTARRSMAHYSEWLDLEKKKFSLSPKVWNEVMRSPKTGIPKLVQRCEADVEELEDLYDAVKHLVEEITR
ncbi:MAG: ribonuclease H-like domain-containing protein [candidate division WOR-3 bacterium]